MTDFKDRIIIAEMNTVGWRASPPTFDAIVGGILYKNGVEGDKVVAEIGKYVEHDSHGVPMASAAILIGQVTVNKLAKMNGRVLCAFEDPRLELSGKITNPTENMRKRSPAFAAESNSYMVANVKAVAFITRCTDGAVELLNKTRLIGSNSKDFGRVSSVSYREITGSATTGIVSEDGTVIRPIPRHLIDAYEAGAYTKTVGRWISPYCPKTAKAVGLVAEEMCARESGLLIANTIGDAIGAFS